MAHGEPVAAEVRDQRAPDRHRRAPTARAARRGASRSRACSAPTCASARVDRGVDARQHARRRPRRRAARCSSPRRHAARMPGQPASISSRVLALPLAAVALAEALVGDHRALEVGADDLGGARGPAEIGGVDRAGHDARRARAPGPGPRPAPRPRRSAASRASPASGLRRSRSTRRGGGRARAARPGR